MEITAEQWKKAEEHLRFFMDEYAALPGGAGMLALTLTMRPIMSRYQNGERTQELYDEMISVE